MHGHMHINLHTWLSLDINVFIFACFAVRILSLQRFNVNCTRKEFGFFGHLKSWFLNCQTEIMNQPLYMADFFSMSILLRGVCCMA